MKLLKNNVLFVFTLAGAFLLGSGVLLLVMYHLRFDTEYAKGFRSTSWARVQVGMSEAEVKALLGDPLLTYVELNSQERILHYSKSRSGNLNYVHCYITVRDGRTLEKKKEVFWD